MSIIIYFFRRALMLKKIGSIASAVLLLAMFLAGCTIPSDINFTSSESYPGIEGVENVQAKVYPRAIQVSWGVAKDAKFYDVYRREYTDGEAGLNLLLQKDLENGYYNDIVGFNTRYDLKANCEYEYTIVAKSGKSIDNSDISQTVLNALAKSPRVQPKDLPAQGLPLELKPEDISVQVFEDFGYTNGGNVLVSWKK
jgi:hypothetical protein